jgi:peptide subunit release factor 1 (eRF1)
MTYGTLLPSMNQDVVKIASNEQIQIDRQRLKDLLLAGLQSELSEEVNDHYFRNLLMKALKLSTKSR